MLFLSTVLFLMRKKVFSSLKAVSVLSILLCLVLLSFSTASLAQVSAQATADSGQVANDFFNNLPSFPIAQVTPNVNGGEDYSVTIQLLLLMTAFTFIPAMLLGMTAFTRIIVVFAILRQALGLQQTPSNQILLGLALFLTLFIMRPIFVEIYEEANRYKTYRTCHLLY